MNVVDFMPFWEYSFLTVQPTYTVSDWAKARPIMAEFLELSRSERGAMFSGWTVCGDKLFCRDGYHDAAAVTVHMKNVSPTIDKLLASGAATLDSMQLHGPKAELDKCAESLASYAPQLFEIKEGCTFLVRPYAGMSRSQSHYSVEACFTISSWGVAEPLMAACVERMRVTSGCLYFGWTSCGNKLYCRQAYINPAGVQNHVASIGPLLEELCNSAAKIDRVSLHGPKTGGEEAKSAVAAGYSGTSAQYFAVDSGFQKFEASGYNLGMLDYNLFD